MIEKMRERDELKSKFIGKNLLIISTDTNFLSPTSGQRMVENIGFEKIQVVDVDEECNLIGLVHTDDKFVIENKFINDLVIENIDELKIKLKDFFNGNATKTATIFSTYRKFNDGRHSVLSLEEKSFKNIATIKEYQNKDDYIEIDAVELIPNLKMELNKNKPLVFQFIPERNLFRIRKVDNIGFSEFEQGFYYGQKELEKAIDDICAQYSSFLKNKGSFLNKIKNILKR